MKESPNAAIIEELNECNFFEKESLYDDSPIWYYTKFEIEEKYLEKNFKYLVLKVNTDGSVDWLVTNRKNGEQFKTYHGLSGVPHTYALDVLASNEDVFSQLVELTSVLFVSKEHV